MLREDGDFTLNRFFILLLAHLTFFPRRIGTPPFDQILEGATNTGTTLRAYQYTQDRKLTAVPDALYKDRANLIPLTITIADDGGKPRGVLRYFPWTDGAVLAWSGEIPLAPLLLPLGNIGLKMMTRHEGVEYSNPIKLTQDEFRQWPERLNKSLTNLRAQLSGFVLKQVFNEGTSEPFVARLMASMIEMRDRVVENVEQRQAFDAAYSPVLDNLFGARRLYKLSSGAPDSGVTTASVVPDATFDALVNRALRSMPGVFKFFNLSADFLFGSDAAFSEGVASLYARDPDLATYLLGCRADWLKQWSEAHQTDASGESAPPSPGEMAIALGRIAAFSESVCVHLLSGGISRRTKSLIVVEVPTEKRKPEYMRHFEVVLAADGATAWKLEYKSLGFSEQ